MSDKKHLTVIEQKEVTFYDDELVAIRAADGHVYVSVSHMCSALGIDRASQVRRIGRNDILSDGYQRCVIMTHHRGEQQMGVLRVDLVPTWLIGIDTKRVKTEIRAKLKSYQREAAKVLWEAFQTGRLTAEPSFTDLLQNETPAVQAYRMVAAMLKLAEQQVIIESRLETHGKAIEANRHAIEEIQASLGGSAHLLNSKQAMHLSQAVKTVALELGSRSGRNEFQGVYGELYRRFEIPSYRELPASQYGEAMGFLRDWWQAIVDEGAVPFIRPRWSEKVSVVGGGHAQDLNVAIEFPPN